MDSGLDSTDTETTTNSSGEEAVNNNESTTGSKANEQAENQENEQITAGDANTSTNQATKEEIGDDSQTASNSGSNDNYSFGTFGLITAIFSVIVVILTLICLWKIFAKASEKGFKVLIPIYNIFILFKIAFGNNNLMTAPATNDTFSFEALIEQV